MQDALASEGARPAAKGRYGFPAIPKSSASNASIPQADPSSARDATSDQAGPRMDSIAGYGSSVAVTACFGFAATARVLTGLPSSP